jgi:hypothetical protein
MSSRIPFPQADNIYKLLIYLFDISEIEVPKELSSMSIEEMVPRQEHYYKSALEFLGLVKGDSPTKEGRLLITASIPNMLRLLALRILLHEPFSSYFHSRDQRVVDEYLRDVEKLSESTIHRRKQTVISWINWIDHVVGKDKEDERS